jgi:hypothetical protein
LGSGGFVVVVPALQKRITIEFSFDFNPVNHAPIAGPIRILKIQSETFGATAKVNN